MGICTMVPAFRKPWCDRNVMVNFKPGEYMRIHTWSYEPVMSISGNSFFIVIYLQDFLMEIFLLFREFVSDNIFPKDWMVMTMVQNRLDTGLLVYWFVCHKMYKAKEKKII